MGGVADPRTGDDGLIAELAATLYRSARTLTLFALPYDWSQLPAVEQRAWLGMARVAVRHFDRSICIGGQPDGRPGPSSRRGGGNQ